ncbi:MAG: VOC family protein [Gemmataceae bacterium]
MRTTHLMHYAFRARDPRRLGHFYANLFEGQFVLHPVMVPLGIILVKINHPEALFNGLLEFWPWDIVWDGAEAVFRKIPPRPSPTSYGHLAVYVPKSTEEIVAELDQRGIAHRLEPRGIGLKIPTIDDPEGNMIELFPNLEHMDLPPGALVPPAQADAAIAHLKQQFNAKSAQLRPEQGYPLLMFEG